MLFSSAHSECIDSSDSSDDSRRRRMSTEYTPKECAELETLHDKIYKCIVNEKWNVYIEVEKSECELNNVYTGSLRRRISTTTDSFDNDIDNEMFCATLETSSDEYDCIPNEDGTGCEEVPIDHSNNLKLIITILCLLLFI